MKTLPYFLITLILSNFNLFTQNPNYKAPENKGEFVEYKPNNYPTTVKNWNDLFGEHEEYKNKMIPLTISSAFVDKILDQKTASFNVEIPFFNNEKSKLILKRKDLNLENFELIVHTENGATKQDYKPGFVVYEIESDNREYSGIMIFSKSGINAVIQQEEKVYEIARFDSKREKLIIKDLYILSDISDQPNQNHFSCGVDQLDVQNNNPDFQDNNFRFGTSLGCLNVAIEIDYFTRETFNSIDESVDWALSILEGVNLIYEEEVNVTLVSNYAYVWDVDDPYNEYVDQSSDMLYAIKNEWNNDDELVNIDRHIVHLFTKRSDTGTGGIAFVNGAGSSSYGFGYSSSLTSDMSYSAIPSPFFHWNLLCTAHELGHNLGSMHTQWCGWPGGPISNCVDLEESNPGECDDFINNPNPEVGTIMSYCHTWSENEGGGIIMKFDPLVKDVIMAKVGFLNLPICEIDEIQGCTDCNACNYNSGATSDDGSCTYSIQYYNCDGLCILDFDGDGICDEVDNCPEDWNPDQVDYNNNGMGDRCEALLPLEELENLDVLMAYPNPTTGEVNITFNTNEAKDFSVEVYNYLGGRIACGYPDLFGKDVTTRLDLSNQAKGFYSIVVKTDDNIITKGLILK